MMEEKFNFIVIDDSVLDCFIAEKMIKHTGKCAGVQSFTTAAEALDFIKKTNNTEDGLSTVVILDVLMPVMSGFEFVEEFESLPMEVQNKYRIVALTSSMNKHDMEKISSYKTVADLLDKPITSEALSAFLE